MLKPQSYYRELMSRSPTPDSSKHRKVYVLETVIEPDAQGGGQVLPFISFFDMNDAQVAKTTAHPGAFISTDEVWFTKRDKYEWQSACKKHRQETMNLLSSDLMEQIGWPRNHPLREVICSPVIMACGRKNDYGDMTLGAPELAIEVVRLASLEPTMTECSRRRMTRIKNRIQYYIRLLT